MRVVLTGAAGFIGSTIARQLADLGAEVVGVDLMLAQAHGAASPPDGVQQLDVVDAHAWRSLLQGADVVCHQAAMVGAGVRVADLPDYARHNDLGTAALVAAAAGVGVSRVVLASSMVVYGEGRYVCEEHGAQRPAPRSVAELESGRFENPCPVCARPLAWAPVDEDAPLDPRSGYAASKLAQEHYVAAWARQAGSSAIALRYHNVYGPGMPRDTPYSGVAAMFRSSLERGEPPRVFEDGGQARDFVHVDDVARANVAAIEALLAGRAAGSSRAYNVCSGAPITIGEVADLVAQGVATGHRSEESALRPRVTGEYRLGDVRHVVASPARAAEELGFRAQVSPSTGLPAFATAPLRA